MVLAAIFGGIYILSQFRPQIDQYIDALSLRFGVNIRDSFLTRGIVTIILTPIMVIPVIGAIFSLMALGSDSLPRDLLGYQEHRLRSGARILVVVACVSFSVLFGFLGYDALNGQNPIVGKVIASFCAGICLFMIYIMVWAYRYYVRIDQLMIEGVTLTMQTVSAPISELLNIERNEQSMEFHLHFSNGERIRVSFFIRGVQAFFDKLNARLSASNARLEDDEHSFG